MAAAKSIKTKRKVTLDTPRHNVALFQTRFYPTVRLVSDDHYSSGDRDQKDVSENSIRIDSHISHGPVFDYGANRSVCNDD